MSNDFQELVDEISTSTEASNDDQQLVDEMYELVVEIEGRLENWERSHATKPSMNNNIEEYPSIFGKWQCWDDFGASFLPETQKWQFVACMTHCFGLNVQSFVKYMQGKVDLAWSYYRGVDEQFRVKNNKSFIEHLLASSCFLIFFMVYFNQLRDHEDLYQKVEDIIMDGPTFFTLFFDDPAKYQLYMLTMNYQIPLFVLEAIYTDFSNIGMLLGTPIHKLALPCFPKYPRARTSKVDGGTIPQGGFKHLLHIFHWSRSPDGEHLAHPTKLFRYFHIPSATDLILSQTIFVNNEGGSVDVSYSGNRRLSGSVMQLTPLHLFKISTKLYEDLLIFEWRYYMDYRMPFTIYVACMACLIKTEADARVLRENGVIANTTFDDKEVLCCVQELKAFIADDLLMPIELVNLEEMVMAHYKKSVYRIYGEFKKHYCSNPWIIISVIAGIILFALTFIQTLYGTLSYYYKQ